MVSTEGAVVEDDDEGYRTSPGSDTSPQSNNTASPPPKMAKKVWTMKCCDFTFLKILIRFNSHQLGLVKRGLLK